MTTPTLSQSSNPKSGSCELQKSLDSQLINLDKLIDDPNFDHSRVLEQALKVIMLMSKLLGNMDKNYVIDNESELFAKVNELKGTYNTWTVLVITIASSSLQIGGGFIGVGSAVPGTKLGEFASSKAPNALGWLSNADWGKTLQGIGQGTVTVGQGSGALSSLTNNTNEAKRAFCQVILEEIKRKRNDSNDASRQKRNEVDSASNNCKDVIGRAHGAAQAVLQGRG